MQTVKSSELLKITNGTLLCGDGETKIQQVSTDSRCISADDLFVPIIGENFDGHDFILRALEKGAPVALTQKDMKPVKEKTIIKVEDTLRAYGRIAAYVRQRFSIPFIGITGSVGKTSTKDMVASVLSQKWNVLKTEGNFNNEIGLPQTILKLDSFHEVGVIEMGMSGFNEISRLTNIVKPDIAIVTNIGVSHIEKLGSKQNILKAKMEILEGLNANGVVILNGDDQLLHGMKDLLKFKTIFYGMGEGLDYQAFNVKTLGEHGTSFEITIKNHDYKVQIPVPGIHHVYNALAAVAAGLELGMPMEKIIRGIAEFSPSKMRMNIYSHGSIKIINDAYNASPQSMEAALSVLKDIGGRKRTIAVLGDMLEMGDWAEQSHMGVGKFAAEKEIQYIFTVGNGGKQIAAGALSFGAKPEHVKSFESNAETVEFLKGFIQPDDVILVKGSRGMRMEEIPENLIKVQ